MRTHDDFIKQNKKDWAEIHQRIFGNIIPAECTWTNKEDIITILNIIGNIKYSNHMFFPNGGGLDLLGAKPSNEEDCIELDFGASRILKPKSLTFFSVDTKFEWNYFRLETDSLMPTDVYENIGDAFSEELTEIYPMQYIDRIYWDEHSYCGEDLPKSARLVIRVLKGSFVIFKKTSIYNQNPSTYDARHETLGSNVFFDHIKTNYMHLQKNGL